MCAICNPFSPFRAIIFHPLIFVFDRSYRLFICTKRKTVFLSSESLLIFDRKKNISINHELLLIGVLFFSSDCFSMMCDDDDNDHSFIDSLENDS